MPKSQRKFTDDSWAVWIDGEDTSTIYLNDWLNPAGKSYVDLAIRIRGIKVSKHLYVYVPYAISQSEIDDISLLFENRKFAQATFSAACIIDYKKNEHTSEIAYNGKTVDIVHISTLPYQTKLLSDGTLISLDLVQLQPFLDNDEAYFTWRMPHKSLDEIFKQRVDMENILSRLRDLITTPVVSEKYNYSIRFNEPRLLPEEITRIGAFHRQKLKKAVITISIDEDYELNESTCYRVRRLESDLYRQYLPASYDCDNVITYHYYQSREHNLQGQFDFFYNISKNSISKGSMFLYIVLLLFVSVIGDLLAAYIQDLFNLF